MTTFFLLLNEQIKKKEKALMKPLHLQIFTDSLYSSVP